MQRESFLIALLCMAGAVTGLGYVILPGYQFLIVLLLCVIFLTGALKPEYTFYLLLFIIVEEMVQFFVTYTPVYQVRIYPYTVPLVATAIGFLIVKIAKNIDLVRTPIDVPLLLVVFYESLSLLWAPVFNVGVWLTVLLLSNYLLFFITKNMIWDEVILKRAVGIWITAGVIAAIAIAASQWVTLEKTIYITQSSGFKMAFEEQVDRPAGLAGVDHVAGFVSLALFMTLGTMAAAKGRMVKFGYLVLSLVMLTAIILTTARGVIIGVGGAYIFFILMHSHFKGKFIRYLFLFIMVLIVVVLVVKPGFIDRMLIGFGYTGDLLFSDKAYTGTEASTSTGEGLSGMEIRMIWWKNGFYEMVRHPLEFLFGQGIGGFYYYSAGGTTVSSPEANGIIPAFLYDMGIFGGVMFLLLFIITATTIIRVFRTAEKNYVYYMLLGATAGLIAETGIHGLIDYDLTSYGSKYFWFPLGFTMAVLNLVKRSTKKAELAHDQEPVSSGAR